MFHCVTFAGWLQLLEGSSQSRGSSSETELSRWSGEANSHIYHRWAFTYYGE